MALLQNVYTEEVWRHSIRNELPTNDSSQWITLAHRTYAWYAFC